MSETEEERQARLNHTRRFVEELAQDEELLAWGREVRRKSDEQ